MDRNSPKAATLSSGNGLRQNSCTNVSWLSPVRLVNHCSVIEMIWLFVASAGSHWNNVSKQLKARTFSCAGRLWMDLPISFNVSCSLAECDSFKIILPSCERPKWPEMLNVIKFRSNCHFVFKSMQLIEDYLFTKCIESHRQCWDIFVQNAVK